MIPLCDECGCVSPTLYIWGNKYSNFSVCRKCFDKLELEVLV